MTMEKFKAKKQKITQDLSLDPAAYSDLSPKGSVDEGIRNLVNEINGLPGFVTTSSCAGRISIYAEGVSKDRARGQSLEDGSDLEGGRGKTTLGKGGGRWLFVSHEPLDLEHLGGDGAILAKLGIAQAILHCTPQPTERLRFVHCKFEPMILHILTASLEDAQRALNAAMAAGFRESGMSSVLDNKGQLTSPLVAVRSSGLSFDSIIGFVSSNDPSSDAQGVSLLVSEDYLSVLLGVANERFRINEERKERFCREFLHQKTTLPRDEMRRKSKSRRAGNKSESQRHSDHQNSRRAEERPSSRSDASGIDDHQMNGPDEEDETKGFAAGLFGMAEGNA